VSHREFNVTPVEACQGNGFWTPAVLGAAVAAIAAIDRPLRVIISTVRIDAGEIKVRLFYDGEDDVGEAVLQRVAQEMRDLATRWARDQGWRERPINGWPALPPQEPYR